jgi:DNA-directed RNA polymerase specialized sigma24 family protein
VSGPTATFGESEPALSPTQAPADDWGVREQWALEAFRAAEVAPPARREAMMENVIRAHLETAEIADAIGVTLMQVSQLLTRILGQVRRTVLPETRSA